ncbi:MAG: hypothetical protein WAN48_00270 [Actinomycetes bacterium]
MSPGQEVEARPTALRAAPALAALGLVVACVLLTLSVFLAVRSANAASVLVFVPTQFAFALVGSVIASRRPGNAIGWICLAGGLAGAFALVAVSVAGPIDLSAYGDPASVTPPITDFTAIRWSAWLANIYTELGLLPVLLVIMLFPNGRPVSAGWRWLIWLAVAATCVGATSTALSDVNFHNNYLFADPVDLVSPSLIAPVYSAYQLVEIGVLVLALASLVVRYRRADAKERLQIKWVSFAVALLTTAFLGMLVLGIEPVYAFIVFAPLIPAAVGISVLRYRLYDIDRIISRTTSYVLVTGAALLIYAVMVTAVSRLLGGGSSQFAVAAATLAAAAAFRPLLQNVRARVDRRFDRSRYDGETLVAQFAHRLEREVDLESVASGLSATVQSTISPTIVTLWLRSES